MRRGRRMDRPSSASGWTRPSWSRTAARSAASCARCARATPSSAACTASRRARVPGSRSTGVRVHDERDLVGAPRRGGVARIAAMMREVKQARRAIAFVAGPVIVHTGGGAVFLRSDSRRLRGRAAGGQRPRGPRRRVGAVRHVARRQSRDRPRRSRAATATTCARSTPSAAPAASRQAVEQGVLTSGVMHECVRRGVDYVLAGSIRDDGPLPDTVMDLVEAQDRYAAALRACSWCWCCRRCSTASASATCCRRGCGSCAPTGPIPSGSPATRCTTSARPGRRTAG